MYEIRNAAGRICCSADTLGALCGDCRKRAEFNQNNAIAATRAFGGRFELGSPPAAIRETPMTTEQLEARLIAAIGRQLNMGPAEVRALLDPTTGTAPPPPDLGERIRAARNQPADTTQATRDAIMREALRPKPPSGASPTTRHAASSEKAPPPPDLMKRIQERNRR